MMNYCYLIVTKVLRTMLSTKKRLEKFRVFFAIERFYNAI